MTRQLSRPSPYLATLLAITPDALRDLTTQMAQLAASLSAGAVALEAYSSISLEDAMIRHRLSVAELALVGDLLRTTPATLEEACRKIVALRTAPLIEVYPETVRAMAAAARRRRA